MRTLASSEPLMKYLSSTGLNWMQVTVSRHTQINFHQKQMMGYKDKIVSYNYAQPSFRYGKTIRLEFMITKKKSVTDGI